MRMFRNLISSGNALRVGQFELLSKMCVYMCMCVHGCMYVRMYVCAHAD